jgi:transposase InsO family protein
VFAFVVVELGSRRVVHVGVTGEPTDAWVAQQLRDATPSGIAVIRTPVRSPRANAVCERFLGSVRREGTDHVLVLGERRLRRVLAEYVASFNADRPHQGLEQRAPASPGASSRHRRAGGVVGVPVLGGLHHADRGAA